MKTDGVKLNSSVYSSSESFELWLDSGVENFGAWIAGFLFGDDSPFSFCLFLFVFLLVLVLEVMRSLSSFVFRAPADARRKRVVRVDDDDDIP